MKTAQLKLTYFLALTAAWACNAEVRMTSIEHKSNGVTVEWTNTTPNYAYTLQYKSGVQDGTWSNVWTRYYWPIVATNWTEPTRLLVESGFYRVIAEPIEAPQRGQLLSAQFSRQFIISDIITRLSGQGAPTSDVQWPVDYYKIVYESVDPYGLPIVASGGLFVPSGAPGNLPLFSSQHGTEIYKPWSPSQGAPEWFPIGLYPSSSGYVTLIPDYLGMGESPGLQPYVNAQAETAAVVDMLRAVKTFCASNSIPLSGQLFLAGHSQGGHATAAAQRALERDYTNEFSVTASAPMETPYDLYMTWQYFLNDAPDSPLYPFFAVYAITAFQAFHGVAETVEELMAAPYDRILPPLYDGHHAAGDIVNVLPMNVPSVLDPDFLNAIQSDTNHPFWQAVRKEALLDWPPQAPTRIYQVSGDEIIPVANATTALQTFTNNGACCVEWIDVTPEGETLGHVDAFWPEYIDAKEWFDTFLP